MKKVTSQKIALIEELVRNKEFSKAHSELEKIESKSLSDESVAHYYILLAETKIWMGDYDVNEILNRAIQFYKDSPDNNSYAHAKCLYGLYLSSLGKHFDAKEVFVESYLNFKRCSNFESEQKVLNYLARVQFVTGPLVLCWFLIGRFFFGRSRGRRL